MRALQLALYRARLPHADFWESVPTKTRPKGPTNGQDVQEQPESCKYPSASKSSICGISTSEQAGLRPRSEAPGNVRRRASYDRAEHAKKKISWRRGEFITTGHLRYCLNGGHWGMIGEPSRASGLNISTFMPRLPSGYSRQGRCI